MKKLVLSLAVMFTLGMGVAMVSCDNKKADKEATESACDSNNDSNCDSPKADANVEGENVTVEGENVTVEETNEVPAEGADSAVTE